MHRNEQSVFHMHAQVFHITEKVLFGYIEEACVSLNK